MEQNTAYQTLQRYAAAHEDLAAALEYLGVALAPKSFAVSVNKAKAADDAADALGNGVFERIMALKGAH